MVDKSQNPYLPIIIDEIENSPIYHRFLECLRLYQINTIYDSHVHVCSEKDFEVEDIPPRLLPKFPFTIEDVNHLYDELFGKEGIDFNTIVFDTPLPAYNLVKKNDQLLNGMPEIYRGEARKFVPFAVITPDMRENQIQKWVESGAKGFKMTPRTTSPSVKRGSISDITLVEMLNPRALEIADLYRLPLVVHLPQLVVSPRMNPALKDELAEVVSYYPNLKVILAHLGQAQTPAKITDLLEWIEHNHLNDNIWMDISAVTIPSVLEMALESDVKLLFGTDIDFALMERGRYVMFKIVEGQRVLADGEDNGNVITALVGNNFGKQLWPFIAEEGIDIDAPLLLFQFEGILEAIERLRNGGRTKTEIKPILENLFSESAKLLLTTGQASDH